MKVLIDQNLSARLVDRLAQYGATLCMLRCSVLSGPMVARCSRSADSSAGVLVTYDKRFTKFMASTSATAISIAIVRDVPEIDQVIELVARSLPVIEQAIELPWSDGVLADRWQADSWSGATADVGGRGIVGDVRRMSF